MTQPPAVRDRTIRWARRLYAEGVDRKDAAVFAAVFAPDGSLRFGNAPPIVGRPAIQEAIAAFFGSFQSLQHQSAGAWLDGNTLVLEAVVTYTRHDGGRVSVPATTIFQLSRLADPERTPLAEACRIYVDLTPLYAPAG